MKKEIIRMSASDKVMLPNSDWCFVCGEDNHAGLQTQFYLQEGKVKSRIVPQKHHCGFKGVLHGGVVASILDECMGWSAAVAIERMCVTAELTMRYIQNVPDDRDLTCVTDVERANKRLVLTVGELIDDEGTKYAEAKGKFTPLTDVQTIEVDDMLNYRDGDARVFDALRAQLVADGKL